MDGFDPLAHLRRALEHVVELVALQGQESAKVRTLAMRGTFSSSAISPYELVPPYELGSYLRRTNSGRTY